VTAVGYGTDAASGLPYWIIKNSWGAGWGEAGYILMYRNMAEGSPGLCGVNTVTSYPIV